MNKCPTLVFFPLNGPGNGRVIDVDEIVRVHCSSVEIGYMHMIITVSLAHRIKYPRLFLFGSPFQLGHIVGNCIFVMSCHALSLLVSCLHKQDITYIAWRLTNNYHRCVRIGVTHFGHQAQSLLFWSDAEA